MADESYREPQPHRHRRNQEEAQQNNGEIVYNSQCCKKIIRGFWTKAFMSRWTNKGQNNGSLVAPSEVMVCVSMNCDNTYQYIPIPAHIKCQYKPIQTNTCNMYLKQHIPIHATIHSMMIEFFPPNSRALLPIFRLNCPDGSHFAQITIANPCSLLSRRAPLSGICTYTKHPQPHPKTPLLLA